jgi:hypothetical protein
MQHWYRGILFLSLALLRPSVATAQAPEVKPDLGANAASKYWQAFALMPNLDKDQEKLLDGWNKAPLDAASLKLLDASRGSLEYLHRGAKLPRCDWSLDYEDGLFLRLPYLPKSRALARLAALNARHEFEQGHWKAGWEVVTDLLKLARHLEMEPLFVQRWVGRAIEGVAIEAAAPYLPLLKSVLAEPGSAISDAMPAGATLQQVVLKEKQVFLMSAIQKLKEAERHKKGSWQEVWKAGFDQPESRNLVQPVKSFEQAVKWLEDLLPFYDQLATMTTLPWKDFDAQYSEFARKAQAANPLADQILPLNDFMLTTERRTQTRMSLFKAALAVVQGGTDQLKDIEDPFGDGPFEYRALDKGFELKSKLLFKGQPVTLTVGHGEKE